MNFSREAGLLTFFGRVFGRETPVGPGKEGAAGGPGFVALACQAGFHSTSIHNTGPRGGREVGQAGLTIHKRVYLWLGLTQERGKMEKNGRGKEKKK